MTSLVWVITGIILLGAMAAGGISLYFKRRRESQFASDPFGDAKVQSNLTGLKEKDDK